MEKKLPVYSLDADIESADWAKRTWDLPPYLSKEFLQIVPPDALDNFRKLPVYLHDVEQGLIHDDEWVADSGSDATHQPSST